MRPEPCVLILFEDSSGFHVTVLKKCGLEMNEGLLVNQELRYPENFDRVERAYLDRYPVDVIHPGYTECTYLSMLNPFL